MTKKLTREMLDDMGIKVELNPVNLEWVVTRFEKPFYHAKEKTWKVCKRRTIVRKHKYAPDKVYVGYSWCYKGKVYACTESRLVYAYNIGDIPDNYDVDHIDNNPLNNQLNNLRLLTREENLKKRFSDNVDNCVNQWDYIKKHGIDK